MNRKGLAAFSLRWPDGIRSHVLDPTSRFRQDEGLWA